MELLNPDTATYGCVYYDGTEFIDLEPYQVDVPYVFHYKVEVTTNNSTSIPKFHSAHYQTYDLTPINSDNLLSHTTKDWYFIKAGTYDVVINLKTFEISFELLPE